MDFDFKKACAVDPDGILAVKFEQGVIKAWEQMVSENPGVEKFTLTFHKPVCIMRGRRDPLVTEKVDLRLCISTQQRFCYTTSLRSRKGYAFTSELFQSLASMNPVLAEDKQKKDIERVKKLARRFHPNAWDDVRKDLLKDPAKYYGNYGYTVTSITPKFPEYVLKGLKEAFENKTNFRWDHCTNKESGRDLTIEARVCEDGVFRAWFSSEFKGCGNGDYWMLINPTTAAFKGRD